ncbi:MAG: hypothetical protein AB7T07_08955 [Steroidobacteraceae bacterium]
MAVMLPCVSSSGTQDPPYTVVMCFTAGLPPAPEKALILQYCAACHSVDRLQSSGGTHAGWEDRIRRMVRWGADIPTEQIAPVAAYLARALPVRLRPPASLAFFANTAITEVAQQDIQTTLRAAATFDAVEKTLVIWIEPREAQWIQVGQRARAFSLDARKNMIQANITRVVKVGSQYRVTAAVMTPIHPQTATYVVEVAVDRGVFLSVPNEAIIDDGETQLVYVQDRGGDYLRREVVTGLQGERFIQILSGLNAGEQVVTMGGFFIDAEYKIKIGG